MEVKVTLEAGQSLIDLVNTLLQGLSRQIAPATTTVTEKKTKKQPKPEPAPQPEPELVPEPTPELNAAPVLETTEAPAEQWTTNEEPVEIDYTKLRAEIKAVASNKRAVNPSVDIKGVFKKHGGTKLSEIAEADLPAVKAEIEAL